MLITIPLVAGHQAQSALHQRGQHAAQVLDITWVLFIGGGLIFLAVMLLAVVALFGPARARSALARHALIVVGGIAFPIVALSALLVYTLGAASAIIHARQAPAAARIQVAGELWWWRVKYLDDNGAALVESANEIRIPAGQPVDLDLVSENVVHSFWVPNLAGKIDMIPGRVNRLRLHADAPGVFRGQCAEFCGAQHAKMALNVIAMAAPEYAAWLDTHRQPAAEPVGPLPRQGQALFLENRCGVCHTIRGTPAAGQAGPDLTHLAGRSSLAAGTLPNNAGALAAWIVDTQHIKPGSRMPAYKQFSVEELRALSAYLASLE